jgi:15-cis-phytoene synthase
VARDTSFYYSFLVLPPEKRRAIVAVWDFCRAVDDEVDEAKNGQVSLRHWREELDACYGDLGEAGLQTGPTTLQGIALRPFISRFNLPRRAFEDLIDGVEMDITRTRYGTFAELHEYCLHVASAVGLVCVEIFGYRDSAARTYASELGVALQLTNILRDVSTDFARGRLYLPLEDLERFRVSEDDLKEECARNGAGVRSSRVRDLLAHQASRARRYYERAEAARPREDAGRLVAAEIMGGIYRGILDRIERENYDVFTKHIRVPRPMRAWIATRTWAKVMLGY